MLMLSLFLSCSSADEPVISSLTDVDGNIYRTVRTGSRVWMVQNLKVTRNHLDDSLTTYAPNNDSLSITVYGRSYDYWQSAKVACPKGWHLPSGEEW